MRYCSSRGGRDSWSAAEAIVRGLAPDGGLFIPMEIPRVGTRFLEELSPMDYRSRAAEVMGLYLPEFSREELGFLTQAAYGASFGAGGRCAPLHFASDGVAYMELYHGPTCAFKDMALQLLPRLLVSCLRKTGEERNVCILVATSGDTGKAALEGFRDVPGTRIQVFYPENGVSRMQELQMRTQRGGNVSVCAVKGNFDDTQSGVKAIFSDKALGERLAGRGWLLSSANSINWGRLLPQIVYYFSAYCDSVAAGRLAMGQELDFCVPTGNFGDILAGWYAKKMGLPVGRLLCASNDNKVLTDFFRTGEYDKNRPFYMTTSPSMDILVSSNLERLLSHQAGPEALAGWMGELSRTGRFQVGDGVRRALGEDFDAGWCGMEDASREILRVWREEGYLIDPHTAVASAVARRLRRESGRKAPCVVVSTASPFKFCDTVLSALGEDGEIPAEDQAARLSALTKQPVPAPLAELDGLETRFSGSIAKAGMPGAVEEFLRD